ncbi:MAG: transposase [Methanospirillum sp.]|nr:transposase [Methanospirillum sp.]
MTFREPDDRLWEEIGPLLPPSSPHGGRRADRRRLFTGVLYVLSTGVAWADAPRCYGAKSTIHRLHQELCRTGRYPLLLRVLRASGYETGRIDLSRCRAATPDRATRLSDWPRRPLPGEAPPRVR